MDVPHSSTSVLKLLTDFTKMLTWIASLVPLDRTPSNFTDESMNVLTPEGAERDVNPLHYAAAVGDTKAVTKILAGKQRRSASKSRGRSRKVPKVEVNALDSMGRTALVYAIVSNKLSCVEILLKKGAEVSIADNDGRTPVHWACFHQKSQLLQLLLSRGADALAKDHEERGPLHICAGAPDTACFDIVYQHQGEANQLEAVDAWGMTVLHWAAYNGSIALTKRLCNQLHVPLLVGDREGKLPTHWAASAGHTKVLHCLLSCWLEPEQRHPSEQQIQFDIINAPDAEGRTAMHLATASNNRATVDFLLQIDTLSLQAQDNIGRTAFHWAAHAGGVEICQSLLQHGGNAFAMIPDEMGIVALHYAINGEHLQCIKYLLSIADVFDTPDSSGRTGLMIALNSSSHAIVQLLVSSGKTNVNQRDTDGNTPMHAAAYFGSPPIVKLLLQAGADPNVEDASGQPPLFYACEAGHSEVVGALLDADAAATYLDPEQRTLLHWASVGGHTAVCQALLDSQQIDVNGRDASGRTALHNAAYAVHPELVQLLLQHQADPNAQDEQGISAVHWAASRQSSGVIQALIDYKAFVNHTEYHPERLTPLDYAAMTGNKEVCGMLRAAGALTIEEVRQLAAEHVQAWWKAYKTRATLLSVWQKKNGRSSMAIARHHTSLSPKMQAQLDKASSARPDARKKRSSPKPTPAKVPKSKVAKAARKENAGKVAIQPAVESEAAAELKLPAIAQPKPAEPEKAKPESTLQLPSIAPTPRVATPVIVASRVVDDRSQQQKVRSERSRIHDIRAKIKAARVIQRGFRRWQVQKRIAAFNINEKPTKPNQPVPISTSHYFGGIGLTRPVTVSKRRRSREGAVQIKVDASNKQQQVAALVIQLAWRKHFGKKMSGNPGPLSSQRGLLLLRQAHRNALQRQTYLARPAPTIQWKPSLQATARPAFLRTLPSPAVTSFNMAQHTYREPLMDLQQQRLQRAEELLRQRHETTQRLLREQGRTKTVVAMHTREDTSLQPLPPKLRPIDPHEILRKLEAKRAQEGQGQPGALSPKRAGPRRGEFVLDREARATLLAKARDATLT